MMKHLIEIVSDIEKGIEPDWSMIGVDWDDDGFCGTCGAASEWPPTGEPHHAVCGAGCTTDIANLWVKKRNESKDGGSK